MDKKQLNEILAELYVLDPRLKDKETELAEIIGRLMLSRPEIKFDSEFAARLRARLIGPAGAADIKNKFIINFNHMNYLHKITYASIGAALMVLIIVPAILLGLRPSGTQTGRTPITGQNALKSRISRAGVGLFGKLGGASGGGAPATPLAKSSISAGELTMGSGSASGIAGGFGRGGGGAAAADSAKMGVFPPYEFINYRFIYKGAEFSAPSDKLQVLKRLKGSSVSVNMPDLVTGLNFGIADMTSFSGLGLSNITVAQKTDFGYMINIFPDEGSVNISPNWGYWPIDKCNGDTACFEKLRVKIEDMPSDQELFAVTDSFLAAHNIDKSAFGNPEAGVNNWRLQYETAPDKENFYFPESLEVIYPYLVDGKFVYDEWSGNKQGLSVSVNLKAKKVSSIFNLTTQNYQGSDYEMETDVKKLLDYAGRGGVNSVQYSEGAKTEELELSEPTLGYMKIYNYINNENTELLIPAFYFPIKNPPKDQYFFRQGVVIPLAKDILADRQPDYIPGVPTPMPLIEPKAVK